MFGLAHLPVIDCHVHLQPTLDALVNGSEILEGTKYEAMNIVCTPQLNNETLPLNSVGFLFKAMHPGKVYVFPGLRYPPGGITGNGDTDFDAQIEHFIAMGADGLKMHEGKPTTRKTVGVALDAPVYDSMYRKLQEAKLPVVFHVGDPWIFWNQQTVPAYAHERGWEYTDGTFADNNQLFAEVEGALKKFPELRIIFAHFYFLSSDLERAAAFLERWPTVGFDLTPGIEMFPNFTTRWDEWRDFFIRFQDRIFFGTDIIGADHTPNPNNVAQAMYRTYCVRNFLETDHEFMTWDAVAKGFALDEPVLRKIYRDNFTACAGTSPRQLDMGLIVRDCERVASAASGAEKGTRSVLMQCMEQARALYRASSTTS